MTRDGTRDGGCRPGRSAGGAGDAGRAGGMVPVSPDTVLDDRPPGREHGWENARDPSGRDPTDGSNGRST